MEKGAEDPPPSELVGGGGVHAAGRHCSAARPKLDGVWQGEPGTPKAVQGGGCREAFLEHSHWGAWLRAAPPGAAGDQLAVWICSCPWMERKCFKPSWCSICSRLDPKCAQFLARWVQEGAQGVNECVETPADALSACAAQHCWAEGPAGNLFHKRKPERFELIVLDCPERRTFLKSFPCRELGRATGLLCLPHTCRRQVLSPPALWICFTHRDASPAMGIICICGRGAGWKSL